METRFFSILALLPLFFHFFFKHVFLKLHLGPSIHNIGSIIAQCSLISHIQISQCTGPDSISRSLAVKPSANYISVHFAHCLFSGPLILWPQNSLGLPEGTLIIAGYVSKFSPYTITTASCSPAKNSVYNTAIYYSTSEYYVTYSSKVSPYTTTGSCSNG